MNRETNPQTYQWIDRKMDNWRNGQKDEYVNEQMKDIGK